MSHAYPEMSGMYVRFILFMQISATIRRRQMTMALLLDSSTEWIVVHVDASITNYPISLMPHLFVAPEINNVDVR